MYLSMAPPWGFLGALPHTANTIHPHYKPISSEHPPARRRRISVGGKYFLQQDNLPDRYWPASYIHQNPFLLIKFFTSFSPWNILDMGGVDRPGDVHRVVSRQRERSKGHKKQQNMNEEGKKMPRENRIALYTSTKQKDTCIGKKNKKKRQQKL